MFVRSSVVRLVSPPISRRPAGELQLTCWALALLLQLVTLLPARASQGDAAGEDGSRAISSTCHQPVLGWVWSYLEAGRGGTVQGRGTPEGVSTSTEVSSVDLSPCLFLPIPPVMRSTGSEVEIAAGRQARTRRLAPERIRTKNIHTLIVKRGARIYDYTWSFMRSKGFGLTMSLGWACSGLSTSQSSSVYQQRCFFISGSSVQSARPPA